MDIGERTYWERIWIVQEVLLPYRLLFMCGTQSFAGTDWAYSCKPADELPAIPPRNSTTGKISWWVTSGATAIGFMTSRVEFLESGRLGTLESNLL